MKMPTFPARCMLLKDKDTLKKFTLLLIFIIIKIRHCKNLFPKSSLNYKFSYPSFQFALHGLNVCSSSNYLVHQPFMLFDPLLARKTLTTDFAGVGLDAWVAIQ